MATRNKRSPAEEHPALRAVRESSFQRVKVACSDIDGVLRGKMLHRDKFLGAADPGPGGGFGFCDVVFGWDSHDQCYDNTTLTGWQHGFPDALARLDLATHRNVPWDDGVPFFLGEFVNADGSPHGACPRQTLKRVLKRAERLGFQVMTGMEFEWFNFLETPQSWADKKGVGPTPITPGMFGYSLLRMNQHRDFFNALMDQMLAFKVPIEGLHTETGPGVYEAAIGFSEALEQADRAILFKTGAKEIGARFGIMPSFMAKPHQTMPGCSGHIHQSLCDGIALEGTRIAAPALLAAVQEPSNLLARSDMMMASMMGAIAFQKDLGAVHACAHALGAVCDLHHGLANALMIDTVLAWNHEAVPAKFDELAHVCGVVGGGKAFVPWLRERKARVGITGKLAQHGVKPMHLARLVQIATADICHRTNPRPCTAADFEALFTAAM